MELFRNRLKENIINLVNESSEDSNKLEEYLDKNLTDENKKNNNVKISQYVVEAIVCKILAGEKNYDILLCQLLQAQFGKRCGGSLLYSYKPKNLEQVNLFWNNRILKDMMTSNQEFVLSKKNVNIQDIYPINNNDSSFVVKLYQKYPYLKDDKFERSLNDL